MSEIAAQVAVQWNFRNFTIIKSLSDILLNSYFQVYTKSLSESVNPIKFTTFPPPVYSHAFSAQTNLNVREISHHFFYDF